MQQRSVKGHLKSLHQLDYAKSDVSYYIDDVLFAAPVGRKRQLRRLKDAKQVVCEQPGGFRPRSITIEPITCTVPQLAPVPALDSLPELSQNDQMHSSSNVTSFTIGASALSASQV